MSREMLSWLEAQSDAMVRLLQRFVECESPSTDKLSVDRMAEMLAEELTASGAEVSPVPIPDHGNHLRAIFPGGENDRPTLVLGHMDTVWELGTLRDLPFAVREGTARGPGSFDMKAGLVQLTYALRALGRAGRELSRAVRIFVSSDEEIGSPSSRQLIEEAARESRAVLVLEPSLPPDGRLKTSRKGVGVFTLRVKGKAAHAGLDPRSGVSAIEEIARQIQLLHGLTDHARGATVNVGTVRGGTRVNVVAAEAEAEIDLRIAALEDAQAFEEKIRGLQPFLKGATISVSGGIDRPPLERNAGVIELYEKARAIAQEIGFELGEGAAGGGSDGNLTAARGVPTLDGLGAVGDGAHAPNEHVVVEEMPRRAALLARLLETL